MFIECALAMTVVFGGHVALIVPKSGVGTSAALADETHATRLVVRASSLQSWRPQNSGLALRAVTLPNNAAGVAIDFPNQNEAWNLRVGEEADDPRVSVTAQRAVSMKAMSIGNHKADAAYASGAIPAGVRVRVLLTANDASLEDFAATAEFANVWFSCLPEDERECAYTRVKPGQFTDRVAWKGTAQTLTFSRKTGSSDVPVLKVDKDAELWLLNEAIEDADWPTTDALNGDATHMKHYFDWLYRLGTTTRRYLHRLPSLGPIFCPPMLFEY